MGSGYEIPVRRCVLLFSAHIYNMEGKSQLNVDVF